MFIIIINSHMFIKQICLKVFIINPIIHPTIFLKRDILTKYKYNQIPFAEDYELYLRLYLSGYKLKI